VGQHRFIRVSGDHSHSGFFIVATAAAIESATGRVAHGAGEWSLFHGAGIPDRQRNRK
jgi:hypothetical protein